MKKKMIYANDIYFKTLNRIKIPLKGSDGVCPQSERNIMSWFFIHSRRL